MEYMIKVSPKGQFVFEMIMPDDLPVSGVILADQIKSLD
jgi:hypothetical protein